MSESHAKISNGPFDVDRAIPLLAVAADTLEQAAGRLSAIESVMDVRIDQRNLLHIRYDASNINIRDIERLLDESGVGRASSTWWRFKSAWYRFLDDNARSNALSRGGACCNRPPTPWSGDHNVDRKE